MSDHDILLDLRGEVKALRQDVNEIKDNTKNTLNDHESRLRTIERWMWMAIGALTVGEVVIGWYIKIHH